jgi:hypothetical protein
MDQILIRANSTTGPNSPKEPNSSRGPSSSIGPNCSMGNNSARAQLQLFYLYLRINYLFFTCIRLCFSFPTKFHLLMDDEKMDDIKADDNLFTFYNIY